MLVRSSGKPLLVFYLPFSATNDSWLNAANFVGGEMRGAVAGANAARHAAALSRPVRGGVGQLDAVAASQNLLQWRMVALLNMLAKLPGKDECCWCTTQC